MQVETLKYADEGDVAVVVATLSERNLETLVKLWELAKVGQGVPALHRLTESGIRLSVHIEPDELHYNNPNRGEQQGQMGIGPDDVLSVAQLSEGPKDDYPEYHGTEDNEPPATDEEFFLKAAGLSINEVNEGLKALAADVNEVLGEGVDEEDLVEA